MNNSNYYTEWFPLVEFPDSQYEINRLGQVRNKNNGQLLQGSVNKDGYPMYTLTISQKVVRKFAHRMVAIQFIPNPDNFPVVNHIDENKLNPCVDNLEWVSHEQNLNHGKAQEKSVSRRSKPINEYDSNGTYIRTWKSAKDIYSFFGLEYDDKHRPSYFVKILTNNDIPENPKVLFANRVFMRYTGSVSNQVFSIMQSSRPKRNATYINLHEPNNVPSEYLYEPSTHVDSCEEILRMITRQYPLSAIQISAVEYAIKCVNEALSAHNQ